MTALEYVMSVASVARRSAVRAERVPLDLVGKAHRLRASWRRHRSAAMQYAGCVVTVVAAWDLHRTFGLLVLAVSLFTMEAMGRRDGGGR